jgi:hypothetical protein
MTIFQWKVSYNIAAQKTKFWLWAKDNCHEEKYSVGFGTMGLKMPGRGSPVESRQEQSIATAYHHRVTEQEPQQPIDRPIGNHLNN